MNPATTVPLGGSEVPVPELPGWRVTASVPEPMPALPDLDAAIADALERPLGAATPTDLARAAVARASGEGRPATAVVVVTDATRECPDDRFLPPLLAAVEAGGIGSAATTILVATGLHRASTADEKRRMLGGDVVERYRVVDHDALDGPGLVDLGRTMGGVPIVTSRLALEADLILATGVVEPHQYAGFSGGSKIVAIGVAGEPTIASTHGLAMLDEPGVRLGRLDGNPFHEAVAEIGRRVGLAFVVDVVLDPDGRPIAVAAGDPEAVLRHLAAVAGGAYAARVARPADVVVAGVGAPKDANLYQATRAVTYLHYAPVPAVRRGGVYLLPATLPEGAGAGLAERRFADAMRGATDPAGLVARLRRDGTRPGEQRAYLVASVLRDASIVVVGAEDPAIAEACGMRSAPTLEAGLHLAGGLARATLPAAERDRPLDLLVVPHAIRTLLLVEDAAS